MSKRHRSLKPQQIQANKPNFQMAANPNLNTYAKEAVGTSIMVKLQKMPHSLFSKDLKYWSGARAIALNPYLPRRWQLMELYMDAMMDLHLSGIIKKRILKVTNKKFKIVDKDGKTDDVATKMLQKKWFVDYMKYAMESKFYGYSLIEFVGEALKGDKGGIHKSVLVDRRYVSPEFNMFLINPGQYEGYLFTEPPYNNICVGIGDNEDLGSLLKLSLYTLLKKNMIGNWSEFAEIFGMPMRYAKTPTIDPKVRKDVEDMLDNMGSAMWGLFPQGTDIEIKEAANTDSFNIYDKGIERFNSEMSKEVLGNTMTTDNGSSKSQGEVHERTEDEITTDDMTFVRFETEEKLFPLLINWGYPLQDKYFAWDDAEQMDLSKRVVIDKTIADMGYKPTKEYIETTYSIKVEEAEAALPNDPKTEILDNDPKKPLKKVEAPAKGNKEIKAEHTLIKFSDLEKQFQSLYNV